MAELFVNRWATAWQSVNAGPITGNHLEFLPRPTEVTAKGDALEVGPIHAEEEMRLAAGFPRAIFLRV